MATGAHDSGMGAAMPTDASPGTAKMPPPEKPADVRRRPYIIMSFWLVVLLLGLPIWWKTTTIYRANLPIEAMLRWADGNISVEAESMSQPEAQHLVHLTQHAIDDLNDFSGHHLRLQLASFEQPDDDTPPALALRLRPGDDTTSSLDPHTAALDVTYLPASVPSLSAGSSPLATYVANQLRTTFAEEQSIIAYLLSTSSTASPGEHRPEALTPTAMEALSKRTTRSLRYAPTYHLAFSLFTDGPSPNTWDVQGALDRYIRPVLDMLGPIHNFTVDTQLQLYATPGVQEQVLKKEHLASFINAAEWPLSPSIGGAPTVNFVIFVGNQTIGLDSGDGTEVRTSQSWMIPQWGTVYLLALPPTISHVAVDTLRQPMLTFAAHLLTLLGTPESGSLPLRLSTLGRVRSADLLLRASSTLGSLARLSLALPSMSIPQTVADGVAMSMHHLELACANLGGPAGLWHARIAEDEAERAFFEKSMVGQLYFPDEHKVAVYLPLLGPVGVTLVMGLVKEVKNWVAKRKEKAREAKQKKAE
ncbi:GPI-anchor transamidase subunit S [Geosmithia morbida]|uniref:GPI-anchor transamidase subunit S n=1 Tax=Geosmithia morbida TaxID=1094350 RepID=A0A9P4YNW0_9HYPO|nr:GPI-anchor transamidase subunit S [Geosmithia morbida]KAF4120411.1 GPI-anchor transamidase subunit S [Geosmithia morbida]